jgi:hypothetical protein
MVEPKKRATARIPAQQRRAPAPEPPSSAERWEDDETRPHATHGSTLRMDQAPPTIRMGSPFAKSKTSRPPPAQAPTIELVIVDETQAPAGERRAWRAAEVWTKRRIYSLDSTFKCIEVLDRETGRPEKGHDMLGARLGGGRLREREKVRFSYPLPLPGMEAMFTRANKHGYTSVIERMIVRVRVLHTSVDEPAPTWDEIASRWSEPPPEL